MRIGIMPQGGKDWIAGVIYLQNLVRALNLLPEAERPTLYFILGPGVTVEDYQDLGSWLPPSKYYTFRTWTSLTDKIRNTITNARLSRGPISFERLARRLNLSALFPLQFSLGNGFPCAWIGWIPDFQHKHMPQYFSEEELRYRDESFQQIVGEASHVVVSSQDAYRDLMRWFPTAPERVSVFPFVSVAAQEWHEGNPEEIISQFGLPKKYLIFPSQFWVHKNHRCVIEAIRILKETSCPDIALVCTGRMHDYRHPRYSDELLQDLKEYGLERNVYCLGLLVRQTQIQLLRGAAAVIQPSFFEGWSSLVEDARTLGKKIYLSDIPIHREQEPPNRQFFDPRSPQELATLIAKDWDRLCPGPDRAEEQQALVTQKIRAVGFARLFLKIIRGVSHHD
jgi:glycosyltransferase involved in cell wall biosynthesis